MRFVMSRRSGCFLLPVFPIWDSLVMESSGTSCVYTSFPCPRFGFLKLPEKNNIYIYIYEVIELTRCRLGER